jgi:stage II sporulation protein M
MKIEKLFQDVRDVFTIAKLKEYLKLPVYTYVIFFVIGVIIPVVSAILNSDTSKLAIVPGTFGFGNISLKWWDIITNNLRVLFTLFFTGIILYIGPLFGLGLNALIHGLLLGVFIIDNGIIGLAKYSLLMVPHGIFEVPALLFSTGAGIILSRTLLNFITFKRFNTSKLYEAFLLLFIAFCLFLIASVIETQVTFRIFDMFKL